MNEQQDVTTELGGVGVLAGVQWAYLSATKRTLDLYSEADGLDAAWLGNTRHTLFRDRLDRVFACKHYAVSSGNDESDPDQLYASLSEEDIATMPRLSADLVKRADLNGSPGWAYAEMRFLLASFEFGALDRLPWPRRSPTKRRVASERPPEPPQPTLFEDGELEEAGGLEMLAWHPHLDLSTYVVAHSLEPLGKQKQLVIGRARFNDGGGAAWHWRQDLLGMPPAGGGRSTGGAPPPREPDNVPDAPVRLRRGAEDRNDTRSSGEG